jgi:hypothetical protein
MDQSNCSAGSARVAPMGIEQSGLHRSDVLGIDARGELVKRAQLIK